MKRLKNYWFTSILFLSCLIFMCNPGFADDTCIFMVTADDVPPNIVLLLDNGAEMEQVVWYSGYNNSTDYTPATDGVDNDVDGVIDEAGEDDVVGGAGNGFFNDNGYGIVKHGGSYYLVKVLGTLELGDYSNGLQADSGSTWTINGLTVTLPAEPSTVLVDGVIDNANRLRYSKNYLNWIFFSIGEGSYVQESTVGHDGSDLPNKSRFYYAKKALLTVARLTSNKAKFGIYNFTSTPEGASNVQPLGMVVNTPLATLPENNTLDSSFVNNINNMGTVTYSPLAEGLAQVGGYYASSSSHVVGEYCQKSFVIVVSPGVSSEDQGVTSPQYSPSGLSDYDGDDAAGSIGEGNIKADTTTYTIPTNQNGSTYLDDAAHYLYTNDIVDYQDGFQNVFTYTIGFMGNQVSNLFLINTSNNGNGNVNLYDTTDPKYGRYHYEAEDPDSLSSELLDAINDIISRTSSFTAPVVPVTRSMSGNRNYMAFFKPAEGNFWEGNVTKFGIDENNEIVDRYGNAATWPNGAIKEDAVPYWATKNWASTMDNRTGYYNSRKIYTYLGSVNLTATSNAFKDSNTSLTAAILGNPTHTTAEIINYIRGADVFDEDGDSNTTENREIITGDVLHSEPLVVEYSSSLKVVYFGANDGMLHAVYDTEDTSNTNNGKEMWAFIPPDQLPRLKDIVEGSEHQYFVDSSPKAFISEDKIILVCGERKGGTSYFALDVTDPNAPVFLWRIDQGVISELGESWSEPRFGCVKTSGGNIDVFFIGGGYSSDNSKGKAVLAINVLTGAVVKKFNTGMDYSFASAVAVIDEDSNGFVDKLYVGDLGGQMWRFGKFTDSEGNPLVFPNSDENIDNWTGQIIFLSDPAHTRKFFYPPSVTLERGYDVIFMGTGDREDACNPSGSNRIYCVKDNHSSTALQESDLVDVTDPTATPPDLNNVTGDVDENGQVDQGWYIQLATGEKVLAQGTVFYKVFYITTFTPNDDPCLPGGVAKLYALSYLTGEAVLDFDDDSDLERSTEIGGGIPSKTVMIITPEGEKLLISVGSTNPDGVSESFGAGIRTFNPLAPPINFFYMWWKELL